MTNSPTTTPSSPILQEYRDQERLLKLFAKKLGSLLSELIDHSGIRIHSIGLRPDLIKSEASLRTKLEKENSKYSTLGDITDIVGIRVITFFEEDVDVIGDLIQREFNIDRGNSVDKRKQLEVDQFGYLSLHFIISLSEERCKLGEYESFKTLKAEIQVRSVLQHAWAEIEHDIGYKPGSSLPPELKRSFSRIAGLLEIADLEFSRIRNAITVYEKGIGTSIATNPATVEINVLSLKEYVLNNDLVRALDQEISTICQLPLAEQPDGTLIEQQVLDLNFLGLLTIFDLNSELEKSCTEVVGLATLRADPTFKSTVGENLNPFILRGLSLSWFGFLLAARKGLSYIERYLHHQNDDDRVINPSLALMLHNWHEKVIKKH